MKKKQTCLVTGGAGFIGSHVADCLLDLGHNVVVLDDLSGGFRENVNEKCFFVKGSITNEKILDRIFSQYEIDYVFHLAAYAAEGLSHFIRKFNYENNLIGSVNLINRSVRHNVKRFVFTSSIAVYGTNQLPMVESLEPHPEDPYGIAKLAVEKDLQAAEKMFGLKYTIFRPHNVYGERQNHCDPYRNVLGIFMNNILLGKPLTIFGDGSQTRAFSYVGDIAPVIVGAINIRTAENEIFNVGSDDFCSVLQLAQIIRKQMDPNAKIEFLPPRNEVVHAQPSHEKAESIFKIQQTGLEKGVKKMAAWVKKKGPAAPKKFSRIEIDLNLPQNWKKI